MKRKRRSEITWPTTWEPVRISWRLVTQRCRRIYSRRFEKFRYNHLMWHDASYGNRAIFPSGILRKHARNVNFKFFHEELVNAGNWLSKRNHCFTTSFDSLERTLSQIFMAAARWKYLRCDQSRNHVCAKERFWWCSSLQYYHNVNKLMAFTVIITNGIIRTLIIQ